MKLFLCLLFFTLCGCDEKDTSNELRNKPEYSVLEASAYNYSEFSHDQKFILVQKAFGTDYNVLAFPIRNAEKGYVVMLTNAQVAPIDKRVPEKEFFVDKEVLVSVKKLTPLSREVEILIKEQIGRPPKNT